MDEQNAKMFKLFNFFCLEQYTTALLVPTVAKGLKCIRTSQTIYFKSWLHLTLQGGSRIIVYTNSYNVTLAELLLGTSTCISYGLKKGYLIFLFGGGEVLLSPL